MSNRKKFLFSVFNISGYMIAELEALAKYADIAVVETPCSIPKGRLESTVKWIDRRKINTIKDIDMAIGEILPDVFFCGGWMDQLLVNYAKRMHETGRKTVLLIDTPWKGTFRQFVHCMLSRFTLTHVFDYAWGAGEPQAKYLRRLGFPLQYIKNGYYCADTAKFAPIGKERFDRFNKGINWPHVFLYVGRYVAVKNMHSMEQAFVRASEGTDWKLRCIGGGELWNERTIHPRIEHLGYKSPLEIQEYVKDAGAFVLPSVYEPWGVVVHEAALMGLPLLCSNQIQAATAYLKNGNNGFIFNPKNEESITEAFRKVMKMPDSRLADMGRYSHKLGMSYTIDDWVNCALDYITQ